MKYFIWIIIIIIIVGGFAACNGDRIFSDYLFEKYCNEEGRVGQFIYERVGLDEEYFIPIPKDEVELRRVDNEFYIDEKKLLIDKHRLLQDFNIIIMKKSMLSRIGPIYSFKTTIIRKSDGKVLSEAVSLLNKQGWFAEYQSDVFPNEGDSYPEGWDNKGYSLFNKNHRNLIERTFIVTY